MTVAPEHCSLKPAPTSSKAFFWADEPSALRVPSKQSSADAAPVELAVLSKGDFFGEMSVLEGLPRDASAWALGEAEVLVMTAGALLVRLRRDPTFAFELLRRLSGRVRSLNARLVHALGNGGGVDPAPFTDALLYRSETKSREGAA